MCDAPNEIGFGWRGWMDLPAPENLNSTGPWINLSHPLSSDMPTPDLPVAQRPDGFDWPVHHALLADGVLVAEHIRILEPFSGGRAEFIFGALNIAKADGAPARVLAPMIRT